MDTTKTIASRFIAAAFLGLIIATASMVHEADLVRAFVGGDRVTAVSYSTTSPAVVIAANECWTGEAPADMAGKAPGHVVVSEDGEARLAGPRVVAKALAQIFDGADHGLTIHAFCR